MTEGNAEDNCLSFFTASHPNHDPQWRMSGLSFPVVCVACLVETLELTEVRLIRKRKVIGELATLLSRNTTLAQLLIENPRITNHLCSILLSLLDKDNELLVKLTIELIQEILCKVRSEKLLEEVTNSLETSIIKNKNLKMSCPYISLVGRLLNSCPPMTNLVAQRSDFLEFLLENISFPEERIQAAILFVLAPVCKRETDFPLLKGDFKSKLFDVCCGILSSSKSREVQLNSLAVINWLSKQYRSLLSTNLSGIKNFPLVGALKKVILCTDETLQIISTQVITDVLAQDTEECSSAREFLKGGIGEFLFESLESNNEVILGSLFCCFSHFCRTEIFFEGGYSMYGIESVVLGLTRAIHLKNMSVIRQGLEVLTLILINQPSTIPLFQANPAVFDSCIRVLQEALKSPEHKVLIQATNSVEQLLQLRHMPPITPLSAIVSLLSATLIHLRRFLKPLTSFRNIKSAVAEELLLSLLKATKRAFQFTDAYRTRAPSYESLLADNQSVASPDSAAISEMSTFLINSLDQLCIPAIMVNFEDVENPAIFETFYFILSNQLSPEVNGSSMLGKKLIASSFLRLSLEVKSKFCQGGTNKELSAQVSRFLWYLCLVASESSEQGQVQELLESTAGEFPGSTGACLIFLTQRSVHPKSAEVSDSSLFNMQCLCIELLHMSCIYQDMFVSEGTLLATLNQYLVLHPDIGHLPVITLKHLVHLFIMCLKKLKGNPQAASTEMGNFHQSTDVLSQTLPGVSLDLFEKIVTTDVVFLEWIFSSEVLALKFGQFTLTKWLRMEQASNSILLQLLRGSSFFFQTFLSLVATADHSIMARALQVLEDLFDKENEAEDCLMGSLSIPLAQGVMDSFHKLLLGHHTSPLQRNHLSSIIRILTAILMRSGDLDIKLVLHIVNNMTTNEDNAETLLASLNFLNVLLGENRKRAKPSIATFLLSNKALCGTLQHILDEITTVLVKEPTFTTGDVNVYSSTLLLVGQLITCQMELQMSLGHVFRIGKGHLISLLRESESVLGMAALVLWKCIFNATINQQGRGFVFVEGQNVTQLIPNDLQAIVVFIQNCLVHESETVRQTAAGCLEGLFLSAPEPSQYADNPWNRIVLESQVSILDPKILQPSCVKLGILLLQHSMMDPRVFLLQTAVEGILKRIPSLQPDDEDISWLCLIFLKEVLHRMGAAALLGSQRESILTWLGKVGDASCAQRLDPPTVRNGYLTLDRTLFSVEMVKISVSKDGQLASRLAAELRSDP